MKRYLIGLIILLVLISACSSSAKKKILAGEVPSFEGTINPIDIPIIAEYKPAECFLSGSIFALVDGTSESESSASGAYNISRFGDSLLWEISMTKIEDAGKQYSSDVPFMQIRYLTDRWGAVKEIETSMPYFEKKGAKEEELKKAKEEGKERFKVQKGIPKNPVRSGDVWISYPLQEHLGELGSLIDARELSGKKLDLILRGWGYHDGRKILLVDFDLKSHSLSIHGYYLFDALSYHAVKSETRFRFLTAKGEVEAYATHTLQIKKVIAEEMSTPSLALTQEGVKQTEIKPLSFEGPWNGAAKSTNYYGLEGFKCRDGSFVFQINGSELNGAVTDAYGYKYTAKGSVDNEGRIKAGVVATEKNFVTYTGTLSGEQGSGTWQDRFQCYGTWTATRKVGPSKKHGDTDIETKLIELKQLLEKKLINQQDYDRKKAELLDQL
jgi:hypothetical protein